MRRSFQLVVGLVLLTTAGCGDPVSQLQQADQSISSWAQTLRTAGELWIDGKVPAKYLVQTTEAADDSLDKVAKQLERVDASTDKKEALRQRLHAVSESASAIRIATAGEDREKVKKLLGALDPPSRRPEAG